MDDRGSRPARHLQRPHIGAGRCCERQSRSKASLSTRRSRRIARIVAARRSLPPQLGMVVRVLLAGLRQISCEPCDWRSTSQSSAFNLPVSSDRSHRDHELAGSGNGGGERIAVVFAGCNEVRRHSCEVDQYLFGGRALCPAAWQDGHLGNVHVLRLVRRRSQRIRQPVLLRHICPSGRSRNRTQRLPRGRDGTSAQPTSCTMASPEDHVSQDGRIVIVPPVVEAPNVLSPRLRSVHQGYLRQQLTDSRTAGPLRSTGEWPQDGPSDEPIRLSDRNKHPHSNLRAWCPQGESNPRFHLERVASSATRRWGHPANGARSPSVTGIL